MVKVCIDSLFEKFLVPRNIEELTHHEVLSPIVLQSFDVLPAEHVHGSGAVAWSTARGELKMSGEDRRGHCPSWDGDPKGWRAYRRKALNFLESTKWQDRYLCGPRLENQLTGRAETAVERCRPGWLSHKDGVWTLIKFLEARCNRLPVPDVGAELETFLVKTKRRKGEAMQQWADRFEVGYQYLRKALARALGKTEEKPPEVRETPQRPWHWNTQTEEKPPDAEEEEARQDWTWDWDDDEVKSFTDLTDDADDDLPEVFPSLVRGWLLLARSALDSRERAAIMASTRGSLEFEAVRMALISNWEEDDLRERDTQSKQKAYQAHASGGGDEQTWLEEEPEMTSLMAQDSAAGMNQWEDLEESEYEAYVVAQQEEAEALATMMNAQRTLRQARDAQAEVRGNRGFFRPAGGRPEGKGGGKGGGRPAYGGRTPFPPGARNPMAKQFGARGPIQPPRDGARGCVRCGSKEHASWQCPDKHDARLNNANVAETAEQVMTGMVAALVADNQEEQAEDSEAVETAAFAKNMMDRGMGIVDLGCTDSMGGMEALDAVARLNRERHGESRLLGVDLAHKPLYSFGDGEKGRAYGKVTFKVHAGRREGDISINGFEKDVPILISKRVMARLGAVLDCSNGVVYFTKISMQPVQLEEHDNHYYMSLVDDLLANKVTDEKKLENFIKIAGVIQHSESPAGADSDEDPISVGQIYSADRVQVGRAGRWDEDHSNEDAFDSRNPSSQTKSNREQEPSNTLEDWRILEPQTLNNDSSSSFPAAVSERDLRCRCSGRSRPADERMPQQRSALVGWVIANAVCGSAARAEPAEGLAEEQDSGGRLEQDRGGSVGRDPGVGGQSSLAGDRAQGDDQGLLVPDWCRGRPCDAAGPGEQEEMGAPGIGGEGLRALDPGHDLRKMRINIRRAVLMKTTPRSTDYLEFGRHAAKTYMEVRTEFPTYAVWCCKTEVSDDCSDELQRFVSWLNAYEVIQEEAEPALVKETMGETRRVVKRRGVDVQMEDPETTQADEMKDMMLKMMGAVSELTEKVKEMESKDGSKRSEGTQSSSAWEVTTERAELNGLGPLQPGR